MSLFSKLRRGGLGRASALVAGCVALALPSASFARNSSSDYLATLALYSAAQQKPDFSGCLEVFPSKTPMPLQAVPAPWQARALCSDSFAVIYSALSKTPLVVIERLSKAQLEDAADEKRTDKFYPDPRLPFGSRAELSDFKGSGLDRGHMSPAANQPTAQAMTQSFALSNMVPQNPANNQRIWAKIESDVRKYSRRATGNLYVFSGPLFDAGYATAGANRVWVPSRLFKLVYDEDTQKAWAYILPNAEVRVGPPVDYATFVQQTGWQFLAGVSVRGTVAPPRNAR